MTDTALRAKLNRELAGMGCRYTVGDGRVEAWHEGYRAGLRFSMGLPALATEAQRAETEDTGSVNEGAGLKEATPNNDPDGRHEVQL